MELQIGGAAAPELVWVSRTYNFAYTPPIKIFDVIQSFSQLSPFVLLIKLGKYYLLCMLSVLLL
jgi:hypothetical protein